jgi:hypothetical protein
VQWPPELAAQAGFDGSIRASTRLADRSVIEQLWNGFADLDEPLEGHVIDNGALTAEETAAAIEEQLRSGTLS